MYLLFAGWGVRSSHQTLSVSSFSICPARELFLLYLCKEVRALYRRCWVGMGAVVPAIRMLNEIAQRKA